jgi:surface antigen
VKHLCGPAPDYRCTGGHYAGKSEGWPGQLYGAGYASRNGYGYHNCTLYAAFRLWKNGVGNPGWSDNATGWDTKAYAHGTRVDQTPGLGSIAQWNNGYGHVAYVDVVTSSYIEVTDDNYGYNNTNRWRIARSSPAMPDNFLHFKDIKPKPKPPGVAPPGKGDSTGYYDPGPAGWHLSNALAPGASNYIFARGKPGVIPVVGDWDGDGKDSTGVYFPWDQSWHLRNSLSAGPSNYIFKRGQPKSIPVVGDWDGDGKDSTGVYFPWDQSWHLRNELNPGPSEYAFVRGKPDVIPVVGDWNGDGKDSTGVYFPWDGTWHLRNELNPGPSEYAFHRGRSGIIPVVGDWNGDRKDSTGAYFPWDQSWHLRNALNDGPSNYAFKRGKAKTAPVVGNWDGR